MRGEADGKVFAQGYEATRLQPAEIVLIQGAGGSVGLAALQLAAAHGAKVLAVQAGAERLARLYELGATRVIDRKSEDIVEAVRKATDGQMASVVLDTVGGATLDISIASTKPFGRVLMVGNASQVPMRPDLWAAMTTNKSLIGVSLRASFNNPATQEVVESILALAKFTPVVPLAPAKAAPPAPPAETEPENAGNEEAAVLPAR